MEGLERPLLIFKPGLDHPPPGTGDGLRDRDIGSAGVPVTKDQGDTEVSQRATQSLRDTR